MKQRVLELSASEAFSSLQSGAVLLDVREEKEWLAGHAPGAVHLPLGEVAARLSELGKSEPVLVICRSGRRSALAVEMLCAAGFDAYNCAGGMQAWQQAGGAVLTPSGQPGTVI